MIVIWTLTILLPKKAGQLNKNSVCVKQKSSVYTEKKFFGFPGQGEFVKIPAGDGKTANLFYSVFSVASNFLKMKKKFLRHISISILEYDAKLTCSGSQKIVTHILQ
jgi:hypothetical protein